MSLMYELMHGSPLDDFRDGVWRSYYVLFQLLLGNQSAHSLWCNNCWSRVCSLQGYSSSQLVSSGTEVVEKTFSSTFLNLCLPKDTWTLLLKTESGGTTIETGWLVQPELMLVTKCEIGSSGDLTVRREFCDARFSWNVWSSNTSQILLVISIFF